MATAIEALLAACRDHADERGMLLLRNHPTKDEAYVYLDYGRVYAIQLNGDSYPPPPYINRLLNTGQVDSRTELESVITSAGGQDSLTLPNLLVQRQLMGIAAVREVAKDFFLDAAADFLSWEIVKPTWKPGFFVDYPIPPVEGGKLVNIVHNRGRAFRDCVVEDFKAAPEEVFETLTLRAVEPAPASFDSAEEQALYRLAQIDYIRLGTALSELGLTRVSVVKYANKLWREGVLDVFAHGTNVRQDGQEAEDESLSLDNYLGAPTAAVATEEVDEYAELEAKLAEHPEVLETSLDFDESAFRNSFASPEPSVSLDDDDEEEDYEAVSVEESDPVSEDALDEPVTEPQVSNEDSEDAESFVTEVLAFDDDSSLGVYSDEDVAELDDPMTTTLDDHFEEAVEHAAPPEDAGFAAAQEVEVLAPVVETFTEEVEEERVQETQETTPVVEPAPTAPVSSTGFDFAKLSQMLAEVHNAMNESAGRIAEIDAALTASQSAAAEASRRADEIRTTIHELTEQLKQAEATVERESESQSALRAEREAEEAKVAELERGLGSLRSITGR